MVCPCVSFVCWCVRVLCHVFARVVCDVSCVLVWYVGVDRLLVLRISVLFVTDYMMLYGVRFVLLCLFVDLCFGCCMVGLVLCVVCVVWFVCVCCCI